MLDVFKRHSDANDQNATETQQPQAQEQPSPITEVSPLPTAIPTEIQQSVVEAPLPEPVVAERSQETEVPAQSMDNDSLPALLEKLKEEEGFLLNEKSQLVDLDEQLRLKVIEEIGKRKAHIEGLKAEIQELKMKWEEFVKVLNIPVYSLSNSNA